MNLKKIAQQNEFWAENTIDVDAIIAEYPNLELMSFMGDMEDSIEDNGNCYTIYLRNPERGVSNWLKQDITASQLKTLTSNEN